MRMMTPAERELRADLLPLVDAGGLELIPHEGWLTTHDEFRVGAGEGPPWRMDAFYRYVRRKKGILMEGAKPAGGKYSFDRENRLPRRPSLSTPSRKRSAGSSNPNLAPILAAWI
jgi:deoxyribodipyrimidine photolyase-related protein